MVRAPGLQGHRRFTRAARRRSLSRDDAPAYGRGVHGRRRISRDQGAGAPRLYVEVGRRGNGRDGRDIGDRHARRAPCRARCRDRGFPAAQRLSGARSARRTQWRLEFVAQRPGRSHRSARQRGDDHGLRRPAQHLCTHPAHGARRKGYCVRLRACRAAHRADSGSQSVRPRACSSRWRLDSL